MREDDLAPLLSSRSFDLQPPPDLLPVVRRRARLTRQRRAAGTVALSVLLVAGAASVVPDLVGRGGDGDGQVAPDARFEDATTPIAVLERFDGGEVVTYFEGTRWCTAVVRTVIDESCGGIVGTGPVAPFALVRGPGEDSLPIDADVVVAGVLGTDVESVVLVLSDGVSAAVSSQQPAGFPRPVWWHRLPAGVTVEGYEARGPDGEVVAER